VIRAIIGDLWDMTRRNAGMLFFDAVFLLWFALVLFEVV
jgi:hypothetical protein